jgi:hypothetical protein
MVCGVECAECAESKEPDKWAMRFLIGSGVWMLAYGGYMVARRRPKWFPVWLAAFITWFTLCKYLICTRCENYGKACDFYYLGKWAARLFPAQPGKSLDAAGIIAEGGSVAILQLLPAIAALGDPKKFLGFLAALMTNQGAQVAICCRRCIKYSTDPWKADTCPSYKLAEKIFSRD